MKLSVVTACCGATEITFRFLNELMERTGEPLEVVIVSNGSTEEENFEMKSWQAGFEQRGIHIVFMERPEPMGSTRAFNLGIGAAHGEILALLHNDLMIRQTCWDVQVMEWFLMHPETGVVGFHGAKQLGAADIYRRPYELHQLGRGDTWSNMEDAEAHGARASEPKEVVTLDGMGLIARAEDLRAWGGLDERYVHHMYDHDLCLMARQAGRKNYLVPIRVRHVSGQTANMPRYNEHFAAQGRDAGIHAAAHLAFYEKWKGTGMLPARV